MEGNPEFTVKIPLNPLNTKLWLSPGFSGLLIPMCKPVKEGIVTLVGMTSLDYH